jgi:CheY-like chemotaxis protein
MYKYKKVIVLDDNEIERFIADVVIKKDGTFAERVMGYEYGGDLMDYLRSVIDMPDEYPDIIFLDLAMPRMNGFEFLMQYETLPDALKKKCGIIILSSTIDMTDTESVKSFPFVKNFITKPIKAEMLEQL